MRSFRYPRYTCPHIDNCMAYENAQNEPISIADDKSIVKNCCPYLYDDNADVKRSADEYPICYEYERRGRIE